MANVLSMLSDDEFAFETSGPGWVKGKVAKPPKFSAGIKHDGSPAMRFDTLDFFFDYLKGSCPTPQQEGASAKHKNDAYDSDFYHFDTYDEAWKTYRESPHKVRKFVEKEDLFQDPEAIGNDVRWEVTGDYIDIGRYLEGEPEHFGNAALGNPEGHFATILINLSATWDFDEKAMTTRGERVQRLVDWLETRKIRTRIEVFDSNQCGHVEIGLKRYEDPLDLDALAVIGHPDFFRRMVFRWQEYSPTWRYDYGTSTLCSNNRLKQPEIEENGILIYTETQKNVEDTNKVYDALEKELAEKLDAGERHITLAGWQPDPRYRR